MAELLLGHSLGLGDSYLRFTEEEILQEYIKAIDNLTINDENRLRLQVRVLTNKTKNTEQIINAKMAEKDRELQLLRQRDEISQISKQLRTWADWLSTPIILTVLPIAGSALIGPWIAKRWQDHRNEIELKTRLAADISECVMKTLVAIMQVEEFYFSNKQEYCAGTEVKVSKELPEKLKVARDREYYEGFKVRSHVIQSEIQAYFEGCLKAWNILIDLVQFVEKLSEQKEPRKRRDTICVKRDKWLNDYEPCEEGKKNQLELKEPVLKTLLYDARCKYNKSRNSDKKQEVGEDAFKKMLCEMDIEAWYEVKHVIVERKGNIITYILHARPKAARYWKWRRLKNY